MRIYSFLSVGTEIKPIEIQVHFRTQIPSFQILGLAGPEIQEARERIMAAFHSCDLEFPRKKVIVNLSPSDVKKTGTGHDLSIALSILLAQSRTNRISTDRSIYAWGALGLNGEVRSCGKMATFMNLLIRDPSPKQLLLSFEDARRFIHLYSWRQRHHLPVPNEVRLGRVQRLNDVLEPETIPFTEEVLQPEAETDSTGLLPPLPYQERLLKIAVTGRHHALILGPKGVGKSQLLNWFQPLSPDSPPDQIWDRLIYEEGINPLQTGMINRPVRTVHSQVKPAHLLGGWNPKGYRPGELSRSHGGILIADEFLEWHRDSKECLREPLQNRKTTLTRALGTLEFHCDVQLIGTGNLCPCGGLPAPLRPRNSRFECTCSSAQVTEYLNRLSGPIADRIDLLSIITQAPDPSQLNSVTALQESTMNGQVARLRSEILTARNFALHRFGALPGELDIKWLESHFPKTPEFRELMDSRTISLRSRHKLMRIARTIQALECSTDLKIEHVYEALGYRLELNTQNAAFQH